MKMEYVDNRKTITFKEDIECFYTSKKQPTRTISAWAADVAGSGYCYHLNSYRTPFTSLVRTKSEAAANYIAYLKKENVRIRKENANCGMGSSFKRESLHEIPTMRQALSLMIRRTDIYTNSSKTVICCPKCHNVAKYEDYLKVKPGKEKDVEYFAKKYGPDWYSLIISPNAHVNLNDYFEYIPDYENSGLHELKGYYNYYSSKITFAPKLICPKCEFLTNTYKYRYLELCCRYEAQNTDLYSLTIFNDEKKIAASAIFHSYYINIDAMKISVQVFRTRLVFNTQTGQTYFIGAKGLDGKKVPGWHYNKITCLTYRYSTYVPYTVRVLLESTDIKEEVFRLLVKKNNGTKQQFEGMPSAPTVSEILDTAGFSIEEREKILKELPADYEKDWTSTIDFRQISLSVLTIYNRFPCLDYTQIKNLIVGDNYFMKDMFAHIGREATKEELFNQVLINTGFINKGKKVRKTIASNLILAHQAKIFRSYGFKDINLINRFLELSDDSRDNFVYEIESIKDIKAVKTFLKDMIKRKGEAKTFNTIFGNNSKVYDLIDAARMYIKFKEADMVVPEYFTDSIKKIHDRLSLDYPKVQFKNVPITYPQKAEKYNVTIANEYEFTLAKDTNELVKIGQELKICVGGYRDSALEGNCVIVSMKQSGKYVGCIEVSGDYKNLKQAKAVCNNRLQEKKAEALKTWVEMVGVNPDTCCDYDHIREGNIEYDPSKIYNSNHTDYHQYELDENDEVRAVGRMFGDEYLPFN